MDNSLDSISFMAYGSVFDVIDEKLKGSLKCWSKQIEGRNSQLHFYRFDCPVYIEIQSGNGILLASKEPQAGPIAEFMINRWFCMKSGVYFSIVTVSSELQLKVYLPEGYAMNLVSLNRSYRCQLIYPQIQVTEILDVSYNVLTSGHNRVKECNSFYELVYVESGALHSKVDGTEFVINEGEIIVCGPGQNYSQFAADNESVSYVAVQFHMQVIGGDGDSDLNRVLLNRIFPHNRKIHNQIKSMVQDNAMDVLYRDRLMTCMVTEIVIRLLQTEYVESAPAVRGAITYYRQDELFSRIIAYIDSRIYERLTIEDICQQFSVSRSALQLLFKDVLKQTPKRYILDLKLEKSCQMLRENEYTVSDIAKKLGFGTIHAFTNTFTRKYHMSPSEYAKRIF